MEKLRGRVSISVSLSDDGQTLAIGAHRNDSDGSNGSNVGHVRIYQLDDSDQWIQLGSDIDGEIGNGFSGRSVSLSSDGQTVAIGALGSNSEQGQARVFRLNGSNEWVQLGQNLDGEAANSWFGSDVSLSSDGNVLAVGANRDDSYAKDSGQVRIFALNQSDQWEQLGQSIDGESSVEYVGGSVSLSADGKVVAIGATHHNNKTGKVRVYQLGGDGQWLQIADLDGQAAGDHFGSQVSLSDDGQTIAVSAQANDASGNNAGNVRIFQLEEANPPDFQSATTSEDGSTVILLYDQELSSDTASTSDFAVSVDGTIVDVDTVSVNGSVVELTLATVIEAGQVVTVDYADPTSGDDANATQQLGFGTDAESLSNASVTNISKAATPDFQSASTSEDGSKVILNYDQQLSTDTAEPYDFTVSVDESTVAVNTVTVNGSAVELTLATVIKAGQIITVDYTEPTSEDDANAIQQLDYGLDAESLSNVSVANTSLVYGGEVTGFQ